MIDQVFIEIIFCEDAELVDMSEGKGTGALYMEVMFNQGDRLHTERVDS